MVIDDFGRTLPTPAEDGPLLSGDDDRRYMLGLLERMAVPVLSRLAEGRLQQDWSLELAPDWGDRNPKLAYLEAFARLLDGIAPWLALPDEQDAEGRLRHRLRGQAQAAIAQAVDPGGDDYMAWRNEGQALVDGAFLSSALMRAPEALWQPIDQRTKARVVEEIQQLRGIAPPYNNWLLFAAMNEAFLMSAGAGWDPLRIELALRKFDEWYVGDGWYGDGPRFRFDGYNGFVIHPMLMQILQLLVRHDVRFSGFDAADMMERQGARMRRYCMALERMIGPDGAIPPMGRSLTYRTAVHHPLAWLAWQKQLGGALPEGRVRAATIAAQRRIFADPDNFDASGFLAIGFIGHQPDLAENYISAGSLYIAAESLLALGLPASDSYWTVAAEPWTMRRAYGGQCFAKDEPVHR